MLAIDDAEEPQHLPTEQMVENMAAIQASLNDMLVGAVGRDATEVLQNLRKKLSHASK